MAGQSRLLSRRGQRLSAVPRASGPAGPGNRLWSGRYARSARAALRRRVGLQPFDDRGSEGRLSCPGVPHRGCRGSGRHRRPAGPVRRDPDRGHDRLPRRRPVVVRAPAPAVHARNPAWWSPIIPTSGGRCCAWPRVSDCACASPKPTPCRPPTPAPLRRWAVSTPRQDGDPPACRRSSYLGLGAR